MNETTESRNALLAKWLHILFYINVVGLAVSLISYLPIPYSWTVWSNHLITAGIILCLFQITPVNGRYRKAAILRTVMLCCTLINALLFSSTVFTLAASVLSILAVYQEYSGHSDVIAELDPKLSRNWHSLFNWGLAVAVLTSFGSVVATVLIVLLEMNTTVVPTIILGVLGAVEVILQIIYLLYLNRMVRLFQK